MKFIQIKESNRHNIFFSPTLVVKYFIRKCNSLGYSNVVKKFKKLDEARIASLYLSAISKDRNFPLWLQAISDKEQSPDIVGFVPEKDQRGYISRGLKPIEVFKLESHSKSDFVSELKRKLNNKAYIQETGVLCHLDRSQLFGPVSELTQKVNEINPQISDIWVIAATAQKFPLFSSFQVWPKARVIDVDLEDVLSATASYPETIMLTSGLERNLQYERVEKINLETVSDLLENGVSVQV